MKKLILALAILGTSIGFADANPAKHHVTRAPWQANAVAMQKTSQPCFTAQGQRASACGTSVTSGESFSQFDDH
jgi:hypothetical protein